MVERIREITEGLTQDLLKKLFEYRGGKLYWKVRNTNRIRVGDRAGQPIRSTGYWCIGINNKRYTEHRLIFLYHYGYLPKELDHKNRVRSDSRIENLRAATNTQNSMNKGKQSNNTSGKKGVIWETQCKKWRARIKTNNKYLHLGLFTTVEEASKAYDIAAKKYFGEFAHLNG